MNYNEIIAQGRRLREIFDKSDKAIQENIESSFVVDYTHNSTAIEGNTLTLMRPRWCWRIRLPSAAKTLGRFMRW